jgi:transposase-like protein
MDPKQQFCSNPECPLMSEIGGGNIQIHSQKEKRYVCRECGVTFSETKDTPYYRLHHPKQIVTWALILLGYGCPPMAIVHAFGIDERTVLSWQKRGGTHCRKIQEAEVEAGKIDLEHVQADELYVKTVKPPADEETDGSESEDAGSAGSAGGSSRSGRVWMAMAICVPSRLWLGGVVSERRDQSLIDQLVARVRRAASSLSVLVCVDGLASYVGGFKKAFRVPVRTGKVGRPRLVPAEGFLMGQVVKRYQGRHIASVCQRVVVGRIEAIRGVIRATRGEHARRPEGGRKRPGPVSEGVSTEEDGGKINTSYIERLNATFRSGMALLTRRGRSIAHQIALVSAGMYLVGGLYNFCTPHDSLREPAAPGERSKTGVAIRWNERTPAMAAGLTDHLWTPLELFSYRVPPTRPAPKKRRGRPPAAKSNLAIASHA